MTTGSLEKRKTRTIHIYSPAQSLIYTVHVKLISVPSNARLTETDTQTDNNSQCVRTLTQEH